MDFKIGLYELNDDNNYNFQLNRLINWDGGDLDEVKLISQHIRNNDDWKYHLISLGDKAIKENRIDNAIGYYRMSEFFMADDDKDKIKYYRLAKELFYDYYNKYFESGEVKKFSISYENYKLPILYKESEIEKRGTILFHGGNDSYFEELFFPMLYLSKNGYDVYLFEGPGQGRVLREQNLKFTHEWEKPVKAILDELSLDNLIIIGVSLGGMLAPRAAAFDKRIKYIVAWSVFTNFLDIASNNLPPIKRFFLRRALNLNLSSIINIAAEKIKKNDSMVRWAFTHGQYAYGASSPFDYLKKLNKFEIFSIANRVDQDVLILQGEDDHFIDWRLYKQEIDAFKNAKSITFRLFTRKENASDHCQCGNTKLALDTIIKWLDTVIY